MWRLGRIMAGILLIWTAAWPAYAETRETEARDAFLRGIEAYKNIEFEEALMHFEEAYQLRPSYKLKYNIGQTQMELRRPHLALEAFEQYLRDGTDQIDTPRKNEVIKEIRRLRKMVGEIVVLGKTGTECRIDNEHVGFLPMDTPIRLKTGFHEITLHWHGEVVCQKSVEIISGKKRIEQCRIQSDAQEGPEPESTWDVMSNTTMGETEIALATTAPVSKGISPALKVSPWIASGLALATMTTGSLLALKVSSLNSQLQGACDNGICSTDRESDVERLPRLAVAADVFFAATAVLATTAVTLFVVKSRRSRSEQPAVKTRQLEEDISSHELLMQKGKL